MASKAIPIRKENLDAGFPPGALVMFENDGLPVMGAILGYKKEKYQILTMRGREVELTPNRLFKLPLMLPANLQTLKEKEAFLLKTLEEGEKDAKEIDVPSLWELVSEEAKEEFTELELCELLFGAKGSDKLLSLRLALITDRIYFRRNRNTFSPRNPSVIEELKLAEAERVRKFELQQTTVKFFRERLKNPEVPLPKELVPVIQVLEDCAANADDLEFSRQREAADLIAMCESELKLELNGPSDLRAFLILRKINHFSRDPNLSLIRHKPRIAFSPEALNEASELPEFKSGEKFRLDLTDIPSFTIDDASTQDMDDALSIEKVKDGFRLGIHISDVAAVIKPGTVLDKTARERATSIYCPDGTINMLPDILCHDKCSLVKGKIRPAISCLFEVNRNFEVQHADVRATLIKVARRYSYDEVDKLLEGDDETLHLVNNIAAHLEARRIEKGAYKVMKRDAQPIVSEGGKVSVVEIDEQSPGRNLIGEMMVLANTVLANFLVTHKIPAVYRGQDKPEPVTPADLQKIPTGPARDFFERGRLKRSVASPRPLFHATLGLDAYVQCTSPIRRYLDLCLQRQILGYLSNEKPIYTADELAKIVDQIEDPLARALAVSKETKRYWLLRYLEKYHRSKAPLRAVVVRTDTKHPIVELDDVFISVPARLRSPRLGDEVKVKVIALDPRTDHLRLEEAV